MTNVALHKKVLEPSVKNPGHVTNGDTTGYTGHRGFAHFPLPGTLTLDLEQVHTVSCIRILIWDGLGSGGTVLDTRRYRYRLSVSTDNNVWNDLYDAPDEGTLGWQLFMFEPAAPMRFIRIYGLSNTRNRDFHVVEIEAHTTCPPMPDGHIGTTATIPPSSYETGIPAEKATARRIDQAQFTRLIAELEGSRVVDKGLVHEIKSRFDDLTVLDQNLAAIRREIVFPVTDEMSKSNRLAIWALVLAIVSLLLTILFSPTTALLIRWLGGAES